MDFFLLRYGAVVSRQVCCLLDNGPLLLILQIETFERYSWLRVCGYLIGFSFVHIGWNLCGRAATDKSNLLNRNARVTNVNDGPLTWVSLRKENKTQRMENLG